MKQVAIAFKTTGPSPKAGDRIAELMAVQADGDRLHLVFSEDKGKTFAALLPRLEEFIGESEVVVYHAGHWRKFLRVELRGIRKPRGRRLLEGLVDVSAWAHQRFPRQRKDIAAIARQLGITVGAELVDLERDGELLRQIATRMNTLDEPTAVAPVADTPQAEMPMVPVAETVAIESRRGNWVERIGNFWRHLTGKELRQ